MKIEKFSPGPWMPKIIREDNNVVGFCVFSYEGNKVIAFASDEYGYGNEAEVEANMHMIGSSIDMYIALKAIIRRFKNDTLSISDITRAEKAIEKANPNS